MVLNWCEIVVVFFSGCLFQFASLPLCLQTTAAAYNRKCSVPYECRYTGCVQWYKIQPTNSVRILCTAWFANRKIASNYECCEKIDLWVTTANSSQIISCHSIQRWSFEWDIRLSCIFWILSIFSPIWKNSLECIKYVRANILCRANAVNESTNPTRCHFVTIMLNFFSNGHIRWTNKMRKRKKKTEWPMRKMVLLARRRIQ